MTFLRAEAAALPAGGVSIGPGTAAALLVAEGFASLAIEMTALRMLVPVAGQSIGVTSIVVTAFLAFLAFGYERGGRYGGDPGRRAARNMALAAVWAAFWLSHAVVAAFWAATSWAHPLHQVGLYACLAAGVPAYLLAETVVVLVECRREGAVSARAAAAFAASTAGNVLGGLGAALVLMRFAGVAGSVAGVAGVLVVGSAAASGRRMPAWLVACWGGAVLAAAANWAVEGRSFTRTTAYADYSLDAGADGAKYLSANRQLASRDDPDGVGHAYLEAVEDEVYRAARDGRTLRVLVVGAGGFTFGRGRAGDVETRFVDVDPALGIVGEEFLAPAERAGTFVVADGRAYLLGDEGGWDAILLDAYADQTAIPGHLYTREFLELARNRLGPGGTLYMNVVEGPEPGRFGIRVERTLRSVFARCEAGGHGDPTGWHNRVYACRRSELDGDRAVYSDADTRGEVDAVALAW